MGTLSPVTGTGTTSGSGTGTGVGAGTGAGAGTAVYRTTGQKSCVTVSLDVKFIAPTRINDEIIGNVQILKKTKNMVFVNCTLKKKDQLVASASGVWKVIKKI